MKLELRQWKSDYAKELTEIINSKKIQDNLRDGIPYPYTKTDAEFFINDILNADKNTTFAFAIFADNRLCGSISIIRQGNIHYRTGELGYYIGELFWGKGIGTWAVNQICRYVFENTDIIRIFAEPFSYNTPSCKVLEKNGFVCEGILRQNAVKNGKIVDMKMYSLIKETKERN